MSEGSFSVRSVAMFQKGNKMRVINIHKGLIYQPKEKISVIFLIA